MSKRYLRESMSLCAILVLLVPKKNNTCPICIDCIAINNITHFIPRLDDLFDGLYGFSVFLKTVF